jgi:DNA sulfur modification protein DndD
MRNFGTYFGINNLKFPDGGLLIISGENMWGKTTILNAVKWALYGEFEDRLGNPVLRRDMVNYDAKESDDWTLDVTLTFTESGSTHVVERSLQSRDGKTTPHSDADFTQNLYLKIDGRLVPSNAAQTQLSSVLPKEVSRFFLFDGEMLDEYEGLVLDSSSQAQAIKDSIEAILGIPALTNTVNDLGVVARDAQRRQRSLAKQDSQSQQEAAKAEELDVHRLATESDIREIRTGLDAKKTESAELGIWLTNQSAAEHDVFRLQQVVKDIMSLNKKLEHSALRSREIVIDSWLDLIEPITSKMLESAYEKQSHLTTLISERSDLENEKTNLEHLLSDGNCPVCNQVLLGSSEADFGSRLDEIKSKLTDKSSSHDELTSVRQAISRLSKIKAKATGPALKEIERQVSENTIDLVEMQNERHDLQERLANHDKALIAKNSRRRDQLVKEIGLREQSLEKLEALLKSLETQLKASRLKMGASSGPQLTRLNREVGLYDSLGDAINEGIRILRDQLRGEVEKSATDGFLKMTTEDGYSKLEINSTYGLSIIDRTGRTVALRSAGAEQIVALALVSALNKNAVRKAPVIMDTPFGRLDSTHRAKVLNYAAEMADQVVLLVHSGEIDMDRDANILDGKIASTYRIDRLSESRSALREG